MAKFAKIWRKIDDMLSQAKNSEEKAKRAMVDATRLADALSTEQEHSNVQRCSRERQACT